MKSENDKLIDQSVAEITTADSCQLEATAAKIVFFHDHARLILPSTFNGLSVHFGALSSKAERTNAEATTVTAFMLQLLFSSQRSVSPTFIFIERPSNHQLGSSVNPGADTFFHLD